ncbi:RNA 2',3'-cyclic phosphodiesterase [Clostridium intestinale]|uniref:RNA 2',3'-cyclic phosphodiesterase n=1 Tax=Clostridium intestinale TaxID=36845 RepID=A0A7D6VPW2_9CLOT|nr:RNA 2',3'-cyclic phosphodiesterase [Clostridium intestinale]QLY78949.1 RNA 2',3'-cyclic phosphodiesterase [Clostridium intestinale]
MRIYIAIAFEDKIKDHFEQITSDIKNYCTEGSFTRKNNFHLTVCFIGEADDIQIEKIKEIIDKAALTIHPFELSLSNLGVFKRKNTNILWMGIEENPVLSRLHKELSTLLSKNKIGFYDKLFTPHITLGRRVVFNEESIGLDNLIQYERFKIPVKAVTLMASKEVNGKLDGVPVYEAELTVPKHN